MAKPVAREEHVILEREHGGAAGVIAILALLFLVVALLKFMGLLAV